MNYSLFKRLHKAAATNAYYGAYSTSTPDKYALAEAAHEQWEQDQEHKPPVNIIAAKIRALKRKPLGLIGELTGANTAMGQQ